MRHYISLLDASLIYFVFYNVCSFQFLYYYLFFYFHRPFQWSSPQKFWLPEDYYSWSSYKYQWSHSHKLR